MSMTFEEALECLNRFDITSVAAEMADWHPAILGQMVLAVEVAKQVRYLGWHPDYAGPLEACAKMEGAWGKKGDTRGYRQRVDGAAKRLTEEKS